MEEDSIGLKDGNVGVDSTNVAVESYNFGVKDVNVGVKDVNVCEVHDEYSSDESEDDNYNYNIVMEVSFEDDSDGNVMTVHYCMNLVE